MPINKNTCGLLKYVVVEKLKQKLLESVEPIISLDKNILQRWIKLMIAGTRIKTPDNEIFEFIRTNYFEFALMFVDHKGNIINLPEKGGLLDQPLDWIIFLQMFKVAFVEELAKQDKGR
ncbi:hypothetical protein [Thermosipho sp. 1074]|uniref:hypothetical protein n=1 Tax=Thermosipho sp. 1074 TaxID=1643331 RepID=UPI001E2E3FEA|nr:hypothetical protein [Thermosipho sp. 1074]